MGSAYNNEVRWFRVRISVVCESLFLASGKASTTRRHKSDLDVILFSRVFVLSVEGSRRGAAFLVTGIGFPDNWTQEGARSGQRTHHGGFPPTPATHKYLKKTSVPFLVHGTRYYTSNSNS